MKKFLRFYLPVSIILLCSGFSILVYLVKNHSVAILYPLGKARLHTETVEATVKINGVQKVNAKVFKVSPDEWLVYAPESESHPVIIIDEAKNDIGSTNSGKNYYELLFGRYLVQSDAAYAVVYASSPKWELNPNLEITDSRISYKTQRLENGKLVDVPVEILFKGE